MSLCYLVSGAIGAALIAGFFGGWINYLRARSPDEAVARHGLYYFLLSGAAAFSVPLFLSLTKSELLKNVLSTTPPLKAEDWFIFFAVCLIAAIYAQTFLDTVSKKVLEKAEAATIAANKATQVANEAKRDANEAVKSADTRDQVEEQIENPQHEKRTMAPSSQTHDWSAYSPDEQKILNALLNSAYVRRSLGGIARDANLSRQDVRTILTKLIGDGIVVEGRGAKTGNIFYQLRLGAPGGQSPQDSDSH